MVDALKFTSETRRDRASAIRRPHRHMVTISAWLRTPDRLSSVTSGQQRDGPRKRSAAQLADRP